MKRRGQGGGGRSWLGGRWWRATARPPARPTSCTASTSGPPTTRRRRWSAPGSAPRRSRRRDVVRRRARATPSASRTATGRARSISLRALGLPHDKRRGFAETYGQPSLIPTPSEERARYLDATAGEIERTLETVDGVVSARVHLVLEEADPLAVDAKPKSAARAAVLLKARPGARPSPRPTCRSWSPGAWPASTLPPSAW